MSNFLAILRALLTAIGAFVIGKNVFGTAIDNQVWESVISGIVVVATLIWSIKDKTANIEMWQSGIRTAITFIGGLLLAKHIINAEQLAAVITGALTVLPVIYGLLSKAKSTMIANGTLPVQQLKKNK